jgi:hypothetical protein
LIHMLLLLAGPPVAASYGGHIDDRVFSRPAVILGTVITNTLDAANIPLAIKKPPVRSTRRFLSQSGKRYSLP